MAEAWDSPNYTDNSSWDCSSNYNDNSSSDWSNLEPNQWSKTKHCEASGGWNSEATTRNKTTTKKPPIVPHKNLLDIAFEQSNQKDRKGPLEGLNKGNSNQRDRRNFDGTKGYHSVNNQRRTNDHERPYKGNNHGNREGYQSDQKRGNNWERPYKSDNRGSSEGYQSANDQKRGNNWERPYRGNNHRNSEGYQSSNDQRRVNDSERPYKGNNHRSREDYQSGGERTGSKETKYSSERSSYGSNGFSGDISTRKTFHQKQSWQGSRDRGRSFHQRDNSNSRYKVNRVEKSYRLSNYKLDEFLGLDPDNLLLEISPEKSGFASLLKETEISSRTMVKILAILSSVCQSRHIRSLAAFFELVNASHFLHIQIPRFFFEVRTSNNPEIYLECLPCLIQYLSAFQKTQPVSASEPVSILRPQIRLLIEAFLDWDCGLDLTILDELSYLESENDRLIKIYRGQDRKKKIFEEAQNSKVPPSCFRSLPIYPLEEELSSNDIPFLRHNVVDGRYLDAEHYLDVQFRLMREDFIQPLRNGINQYRHLRETNSNFRHIKDISLYTNVRILYSVCNLQGVQHHISFDNAHLKRVNWKTNKRFLNGSLLCFSSDEFQTMLFATVSCRDEASLSIGHLGVCFENKDQKLQTVSPNENFLMAETNAFFEAYRHNLLALQKMNEENFPMKQYIIEVRRQIDPPGFLKKNTKYDLRPLLLPFPKEFIDKSKGSYDDGTFEEVDDFPPTTKWVKEISILEDNAWPLYDDFNLDISQFSALKMALTQEFAIIQGPPGTGKTFIGLRVLQVLLQNESVWNPEGTSPMLIVCFTNHALDQFLEGITNLIPKNKIVRVGGRCTSKKLDECRLMNMRLANRNARSNEFRRNRFKQSTMEAKLKQNRFEVTTRLLVLESKLKNADLDIKRSFEDVLLEDDLREFMTDEQYENFVAMAVKKSFHNDGRLFMDWLELRQRNTQGNQENEKTSEEEEEEEVKEEEEAKEDVAQEKSSEVLEETNFYDTYFEDPSINDDLLFEERLIDKSIEKEVRAQIKEEQRAEGEWTRDHGWRTRKKAIQQKFRSIKKPMSKDDAERITDLWNLPLSQRWLVYHCWAGNFVEQKYKEINDLRERFDNQLKILAELRHSEDLNLMQNCMVVGMTTTGAAKYNQLVQELKPPIVIVEEAAEVMETHIVTALTKETKQVILIGDHQQLRPNPASYKLAKDYNLDVSLFERMVKNNMPCQQLVTQHRMRPCIASLLVPNIYPILKNAVSVRNYENVKGIKENMYFVTHDYIEGNEMDSHSKSNIHEATFLINLTKYLLQQGYKNSEITILSTYSGQCASLERLMKDKQLDVKICSVDNYQGEENEIILISFVRSNTIGSIGFLDISNRVCVALSRARKGLYCIGNFRLLAEQNDLWKIIVKKLEDLNAIGVDLRLFCQNHSDTFKDVCRDNDFHSVPEGGCTRLCKARLSCGHVCGKCCHPYDKEHLFYQCKEKCKKVTCALQHRCPKACFQCFENEDGCGPCIVRVEKELPCGHRVMMACSERPSERKCGMPCGSPLNCGHFCTKACGSDCEDQCKIQVRKTSICSHSVTLECYKSKKQSEILSHCRAECNMELICGHKCKGKCGTCFQGRLHASCSEKCNRLLVCGHLCKAPCSAICPACTQKCETQCTHSHCDKMCGVPCEPCRMRCDWQCKHKKCKNLCSELCSRDVCDLPCEKELKCGHPCIGFCGERCPKKCLKCSKDIADIADIEFGFEDEPDARFVVLECDHVFESKGLIQWFEKCVSNDQVIRMLRCPQCQKVIHHNQMLGRFIKKALSGVEKVKEKVFGFLNENKQKLRDLKILHKCLSESGKVNKIFSQALLKMGEEMNKGDMENSKLAAFSNFLVFIQCLDKAEEDLWKCGENVLSTTKVYNTFLNDHLTAFLLRLVDFIHSCCEQPSQQQITDLHNEVNRYQMIVKLIICKEKAMYQQKSSEREINCKFMEAMDLLLAPKPLTDSARNTSLKSLRSLKTMAGKSVIGISDREKSSIIRAVGLSQGHWYQCPNGHVYCIGECGGATELGKCNECKANIGGLNHALLENNRVATAMDGATHSSWSEAANLNNYDIENFID